VHKTQEGRRGFSNRLLISAAIAALAVTAVATLGGASASAAPRADVKIHMELVLTGVQFARDAALGMKTASTAAGQVSMTVTGPPSINPVLAQQQVTQAVSQSPDGIGIDPFTPDLWQRTLKDVAGQVKNILLMNDKPVISPSQLDSASVNTYVGLSDANYARALANVVISGAHLSPSTTGTVLLGQCVPGATGVLAERNTAFLQIIHKRLPKTKVIQFNSEVVPAKNTSAWTSQLSAHPTAVLALGGCDQDGTSLYLVKKKLHLKVAAGGIDLTPEAVKGVADGTLVCTLNDDYFVQGYVAASLLIKGARGQALPQGWIDTGYTIVTKSNIKAITKATSSDAARITYWKPRAEAILKNLKVKPLVAAWGGLTN
jgi:ABC-type sugar transport system substrate-binding protein